MKEFIHNFANGNIQIKYYLVRSVYSRKKKDLDYSSYGNCIIVINRGSLRKYYDHIGGTANWPFIVLTILFLALRAYIVGMRILQVKRSGEIFFFDEHLEIHQNNKVRSLTYSEITRIEYCGELPTGLLQTEVWNG